MESHLQALIVYFSAHPHVALAAVFAAAALEALALIGTVIPGSSVVFIGGVLIGLNVLNPWWTALAAVTGAILGDGVSYWLGHYYRERLRTMWPMRNYPALFDRGQAYFASNGGKSVFFGRFVGPVRAIVPVIAGISRMRPLQFYSMNIASALAWSAAHILPGILFGASLQVAGAVSSRLVMILLGFAALFWLLHRSVRLLFRFGWPHVRSLRDRLVARAQRSSGRVARLVLSLLDPSRAESHALLTAAILLVAGAWLFLGILEDVISNDPLVQFDHSVYALLQNVRTEWGDQVMVAITEVGGPAGTIALVVTTSLFFAYRRYWHTLGYWLAAAGFAEMLVWVLKFTVGRARPHNIYSGTEQFSFPSGHTTLSIVIYGFMAFLLANTKPVKQKVAVTVAAAVVITLISFSRLYLGVHWFSDVVASLSLGLMWVALLSIAYTHHVSGQQVAALPFSLVVLATLGLVSIFYLGERHTDDVKRYAYQHPTGTTLLVDWTNVGWRNLPSVRADLEGEFEEPFSIQWVGTAAELATTLTEAEWHTPQPWTLKAMLLWLLPQTPIEQLPILSKFDHGLEQKLTFVKVLSRNARAVIRLWQSPYAVQPTAGAPSRPLWEGTLTIERLRPLSGIVTFARTEADFNIPIQQLQQDLQRRHASIERRERHNTSVLLIW